MIYFHVGLFFLGINKVQALNEFGSICYGRNAANANLRVIVCPVRAPIDIFKGLWDMIVALTTDPLGFFKGIGNAVLHPVDTLNYMWGAVETAWERDVVNGNARSRGEFFSYALVSIVGLKGIDKVAKVGKFNKLGKGGAKVDGNNSLSSAAKVHTSNSLVPIPFNVLQTVKLKELVKHNVVSAFSKGSQWTKDFFKNDLVQKALKQGVVAIGNARILNNIRNVVNPRAFKTFFGNTFNDVIKGPLFKTNVAIDHQFRKVVEGIGKVEVPTRIRIKSIDFSIGMRFPVVDLGITTMKDVVQKISGCKSEKNRTVITEGTNDGFAGISTVNTFVGKGEQFTNGRKNKLKPDIRYKTGEYDYFYETDKFGRISKFETENFTINKKRRQIVTQQKYTR